MHGVLTTSHIILVGQHVKIVFLLKSLYPNVLVKWPEHMMMIKRHKIHIKILIPDVDTKTLIIH